MMRIFIVMRILTVRTLGLASRYFFDLNVVVDAPWSRSWCDTLDEASTAFGKTLNVGQYHKQWMEEAGYEDVHERVVKVSISVLASK